MSKILTTVLIVLAWCSLLFSYPDKAIAQATPVDPQTAAQLQIKLDNLITQYNLKGLSASVIIPGKGTWNGVSGISHAGVPIDPAMVFGLGSITKTFVAATVMKLVQDSLLSLSDSIHTWLPNPYPNIDPNITVRQLLQHRTGLYNYPQNQAWGTALNSNLSATWTADQILNNFVLAPNSAPGVAYSYCNTNYLLLGRIIEEVTNSAWWNVVRNRLLTPLQLSSMFAVEREAATGSFPHNWQMQQSTGNLIDLYNLPKAAAWTGSDAAGIMASNAYDVARFGQALFQGQVLQDTTLQLMRQFLPVNAGIFSGYGLGMMRFGTGNAQAWGHNGIIHGFSSCLMFSPADSIVVSLLANTATVPTNLAWSLLATARQQLVTAVPDEIAGSREAIVCYPNPAQGKGSIKYSLRKAQPVEITLQNSLGQNVQTLLSEPQQAGEHSLDVDTKTLASGMYFCTLQTADSKRVQRWVLTR
jgi:D-alanyl-D-alanine carboxypeptidase